MKYTIFTRKNIYPFFLNVLDKGYSLKRLIKEKMKPEFIAKITDLTIEEIEKLK